MCVSSGTLHTKEYLILTPMPTGVLGRVRPMKLLQTQQAAQDWWAGSPRDRLIRVGSTSQDKPPSGLRRGSLQEVKAKPFIIQGMTQNQSARRD